MEQFKSNSNKKSKSITENSNAKPVKYFYVDGIFFKNTFIISYSAT